MSKKYPLVLAVFRKNEIVTPFPQLCDSFSDPPLLGDPCTPCLDSTSLLDNSMASFSKRPSSTTPATYAIQVCVRICPPLVHRNTASAFDALHTKSVLQTSFALPLAIHTDNNSLGDVSNDLHLRQYPQVISVTPGGPERTFSLDRIFDSMVSQKQVNTCLGHLLTYQQNEPCCYTSMLYDATVAPIFDSVWEGFNGTVIAYGPTGSGKTYTMQGTLNDDTDKADKPCSHPVEGPAHSRVFSVSSLQAEKINEMLTDKKTERQNFQERKTEVADGHYCAPLESMGVIPRAILNFFDYASQSEQLQSWRTTLKVSALEIYNEKLHDLLATENIGSVLKLREHQQKGVFVETLTEHDISSPTEGLRLVAQAQSQRAKRSTGANATSSRSHMIFTLIINRIHSTTSNSKSGRLHLVDLAGSEKLARTGAEGMTFDESKMINKSLAALGNVISALATSKSKTFIPYRDSKLTRILRDSLGGTSKTCIICTVCPEAEYSAETLSTLRFGQRAKMVTNTAVINQVKPEAEVLRELLQTYIAEAQQKQERIVALEAALEAAMAQCRQATCSSAQHFSGLGDASSIIIQNSNSQLSPLQIQTQNKPTVEVDNVELKKSVAKEPLLAPGLIGTPSTRNDGSLSIATDINSCDALSTHSPETPRSMDYSPLLMAVLPPQEHSSQEMIHKQKPSGADNRQPSEYSHSIPTSPKAQSTTTNHATDTAHSGRPLTQANASLNSVVLLQDTASSSLERGKKIRKGNDTAITGRVMSLWRSRLVRLQASLEDEKRRTNSLHTLCNEAEWTGTPPPIKGETKNKSIHCLP